MTNTLGAGFWMPEQASSYAAEVDWAFFFVLWISVFFTLLITALVLYFAIRHWDGGRRGVQKGHGGRGAMGKGPSHHTALEMTWTIIPLVLVLAIFYVGFRGFINITTPPAHAYEIIVRATSWNWQFQYPNGHVSETLYVPVNEPVRVVLTVPRGDVIHSFFVPEFRTKMDAVPGRYNEAWFEPTRTGEFTLYCTEYCGQGHAVMLADVVVLDRDEFDEAIDPIDDDVPPHERGLAIAEGIGGCFACHTDDGSDSIGPTFLDLYGSTQMYADGQERVVDRNHLRRALERPSATVREGFDAVMPPYEHFSDQQINDVIAYLQSISEHYEGPEEDEVDEDAPENAADADEVNAQADE